VFYGGISTLVSEIAQAVLISNYRLDYRGSSSGRGNGFFSSSLSVQTNSEAHPASYPMDTGGPFLGGKARLGRDADH
jgi:hypothetical protein